MPAIPKHARIKKILLFRPVAYGGAQVVDISVQVIGRRRRGVCRAAPRNCRLTLMEERFGGRGHWENAPMYRVLMTLIRKRPRDLVKLCTMAARNARIHGKDIITTKDFESSFAEYSQERLQDTVNEFKSELPHVERLLLGMKPSKIGKTSREGYVYTTADLLKKIGNIQEQGRFYFSGGKMATSKELSQFMYKVNFLTARKESPNGHIERRYFEESRYLQSEFADFGFAWEVHPAYRWALQPDSVDSILEHLELSADV